MITLRLWLVVSTKSFEIFASFVDYYPIRSNSVIRNWKQGKKRQIKNGDIGSGLSQGGPVVVGIRANGSGTTVTATGDDRREWIFEIR